MQKIRKLHTQPEFGLIRTCTHQVVLKAFDKHSIYNIHSYLHYCPEFGVSVGYWSHNSPGECPNLNLLLLWMFSAFGALR